MDQDIVVLHVENVKKSVNFDIMDLEQGYCPRYEDCQFKDCVPLTLTLPYGAEVVILDIENVNIIKYF